MIDHLYIKRLAVGAGFAHCGIAPCRHQAENAALFRAWLARGRQSSLGYLERNVDKRFDARRLVEGARTAVVCAVSYKNRVGEGYPPGHRTKVASYACAADYHATLRTMLGGMLDALRAAHPGLGGRAFVATAPLAESFASRRWAAASRADLALNGPVVLDAVEAKLGYPIFVKPANAGSSVGISKAADRAMLEQAVEIALREDDKVVFEEFVDAQEVECAAIGNPDAPSTVATTRPGEILAGAEFYTYDDKYKHGVSQTVIPAHLSEEKLDEVKAEARKAYLALNCAGLSRCDFFVEKDTGRVLINEINTLPGYTPQSM